MKLYATLETSRGKVVSVSDNEQIVATVYDGNMKAYSVTIEWCDIGDLIDNEGNDLPESKKTKGAVVTSREWRNQPDERRKKAEEIDDAQARAVQNFGEQHPRFHSKEMKAWRAKGKKDICNFNACKNKAVYYGVCEKHKIVEN